LINGGPISIEWPASNIPSIVESLYPGEEGGNAIADVIFGSYNPSGRLPITIYPENFVNQITFFSMDMRQTPGKTYRFFTGSSTYEFGFGLSYTTFVYQFAPNSEILLLAPQEIFDFRVNVSNTGSFNGDVSVLGFISKISNSTDIYELPMSSTVNPNNKFSSQLVDPDCPLSQLFDFQKINLWPHESVILSYSVGAEQAHCVDSSGNKVIKSGTYQVLLGDVATYFVVPDSIILDAM